MEADIIVVAASATETARLLLNSKSNRFPNGIGNDNDWVGRNLQGHAYCGAKGLFDYDVLDLKGPGATVAIMDYNHHNEGIVGGGLLCNEFYQMLFRETGLPDILVGAWNIRSISGKIIIGLPVCMGQFKKFRILICV